MPSAKKTAKPVKKTASKSEKSKAAKSAADTKPLEAKKAKKPPFKKEMTQKLLNAKSRILQEVSHKIKSESSLLKFEIGDIYDAASNERERELSLMLGDREREKLSEIEDALERIRGNTYGGCEECGEPIAEDRLRALPFTRLCVECRTRNEREQKIKGRFEEESGLGILERGESEEEEF